MLSDELSISVLDRNGPPIPTTDPSGADALVTVDIQNGSVVVTISSNDVIVTPTFTPGRISFTAR